LTKKFVPIAINLFLGERNGKKTGVTLSFAVKGVKGKVSEQN